MCSAGELNVEVEASPFDFFLFEIPGMRRWRVVHPESRSIDSKVSIQFQF